MSLTLQRARAAIITAPLNTPFRIATGQHDQLENVFFQVQSTNGISGYGEAAVASHITGETVEQTLANLQKAATELIDRDCTDPVALIDQFRSGFDGNHAALAAFEMALLDLVSRSRGIPFGGLFSPAPGFTSKPRFSSDITIVIGSLEEAETAARHYAGQGFTAFKIKIGKEHDLDLQRVLAVKRIAPDSSLILDANMGFDAAGMLKFLKQLEQHNIRPMLLEQPVPKGDWDGLAAITRELSGSGMLVCADESVGSLAAAEQAVSLGAVNAINIKFMKSGITESVRIAELACRNNIRLMLGAMMESSLAITAAAHFAATLGCFEVIDLDTTFFINGPLSQSPYLAADGRFDLTCPAPGIGVELSLP
ncbi:MAG: dipeptide epimerase [Trichlorobacter sp.]|uniref:dipeptide epimerase n=1 Tax=Trichlorobacter sp. TaxID=2911007 RepID=UPI00256B32E7|nr:dipeptide epimerase [Trichlorobacter sp.]MDK9717632.1 dipeptide epimerase [Trichlorobacter sp.]